MKIAENEEKRVHTNAIQYNAMYFVLDICALCMLYQCVYATKNIHRL